MADAANGMSCPLCLKTYEPAGMVDIAIPHHAVGPGARVQVCNTCANAIVAAITASSEPAAAAEA